MFSNSSTENRLKFAFNVLVRFLVPFCNGLVRGWNGIRGFRVLSTIKNIPYNRQALTNAFAFAANNISLGLSTSQGKTHAHFYYFLFKMIIKNWIHHNFD